MATIKDLPHRNWAWLRDQWISNLPDIDGINSDAPTIETFGVFSSKRGCVDREHIGFSRGVREAVFRDFISAYWKGRYMHRVGMELSKQGMPTWCKISLYEAGFFFSRSIIALMGISPCSRDSNFYFDAFAKKKVGKKSENTFELFQLRERMTHSQLWEITERVFNTFKSDEHGEEIRLVRKFNFSEMSKFRNSIMYVPIKWPYWTTDGSHDLLSTHQEKIFRDARIELGIVSELEETWLGYNGRVRELLDLLIEDLARTAPAVQRILTMPS